MKVGDDNLQMVCGGKRAIGIISHWFGWQIPMRIIERSSRNWIGDFSQFRATTSWLLFSFTIITFTKVPLVLELLLNLIQLTAVCILAVTHCLVFGVRGFTNAHVSGDTDDFLRCAIVLIVICALCFVLIKKITSTCLRSFFSRLSFRHKLHKRKSIEIGKNDCIRARTYWTHVVLGDTTG